MAKRAASGRFLVAVVAVVPAVIVAAIVASFAWASHDPTVVHACTQKNNGQVRIVSGPEECRPSETHQELAAASAAPGGGAGLEAYARVEDGALDVARSKNVVGMTAATRSSGGTNVNVYCFDLTFVPLNAVATGEVEPGTFGGGAPHVAVAGTDALAALPCPAGTDAAVQYGNPVDDSVYARFTT